MAASVARRRSYVVAAVVVLVVLAAAIGAASRQSAIDDLTGKNETLSAGKALAIRQRNAAVHELDHRVEQQARDEAIARTIEARRPPGATLYAVNCAPCHGADGEGGMGPQLLRGAVASHLSEEEEVGVVTFGRGGMPAWRGAGGPGGALSPEAIQQVVAYTRTH